MLIRALGHLYTHLQHLKHPLKVATLGLFISSTASADFPPQAQWQQIKVDGYQIIFTPENEAAAQQVAADLLYYLPLMEDTLPQTRRITSFPIILANSAHEANGFVQTTPYRSVFYNLPFTSMGSGEWLNDLVIHEGRHIQQFTAMRNNTMGRATHILGGQSFSGLWTMVRYPMWFFEGDAVLNETLWTQGGRGRTAQFSLWTRTRELEGDRYNFHRAYLGTGRDSVPFVDFYEMGYHLVTYFNRQYGNDFWNQVIADTGNRLSPLTFSGHIRRHTGLSLEEHYQRAMDELRAEWTTQQEAVTITPVAQVSPSDNSPWQGQWPVGVTGERVISLTMSAARAPILQTWIPGADNRDAEKLRAGNMSMLIAAAAHHERPLSMGAAGLCWIQEQPDPRYSMISYGDLNCLSADGKQHQRLSRAQKWVNVATHPQDIGWVVTEFLPNRDVALVQLDGAGNEVQRWTQPSGSMPFDLQFSASGQHLVFSRLEGAGYGLYQLNMQSGELTTLREPSANAVLRSPILVGNWLFYTSDQTGIDQIWARDMRSGEHFLAVQRPYSTSHLVYDAPRQQLLFSDYQATGYQVAGYGFAETTAAAPAHWVVETQVDQQPIAYFAPLLNDNHIAGVAYAAAPRPTEPFDVTPYKRSQHAVNVHSWSFGYSNSRDIRGSIASTNALDSFSFSLSAEQDLKAREPSLSVQLENSRWYPVLGLTAASELQRRGVKNSAELRWRQNLVGGFTALPLTFQSYARHHGIQPYAGLSWVDLQSIQGPLTTNQGAIAGAGVIYQHGSIGAFRDAAPRQGLMIDASWATTIDNWSDFSWSRRQGAAYLALPGAWHNHAVALQGIAFKEDTAPQNLAPVLEQDRPVPRGYESLAPGEQGGLLSATYRLPLGAINENLGPLFYFKRLNLQFSADHAFVSLNDNRVTQSSLGTAISVPTNVFNNVFAVLEPTLGIYYRIEDAAPRLQFSLSAGNL